MRLKVLLVNYQSKVNEVVRWWPFQRITFLNLLNCLPSQVKCCCLHICVQWQLHHNVLILIFEATRGNVNTTTRKSFHIIVYWFWLTKKLELRWKTALFTWVLPYLLIYWFFYNGYVLKSFQIRLTHTIFCSI